MAILKELEDPIDIAVEEYFKKEGIDVCIRAVVIYNQAIDVKVINLDEDSHPFMIHIGNQDIGPTVYTAEPVGKIPLSFYTNVADLMDEAEKIVKLLEIKDYGVIVGLIQEVFSCNPNDILVGHLRQELIGLIRSLEDPAEVELVLNVLKEAKSCT